MATSCFQETNFNTANTNLPSIFFGALLLDSFLMKEGKKTPTQQTQKFSEAAEASHV